MSNMMSSSPLSTDVEGFVDHDFPQDIALSNYPGSKNYEWVRATQLCEGEQSLFGKVLSPTDVVEGELADCYFIAAVR